MSSSRPPPPGSLAPTARAPPRNATGTTSSASSSGPPRNPPGQGARSPESFASLQTRMQAAEILQSYEKLSWISFQRSESLAQTRLHFQNIVAGFSQDDEEARVDWKEDFRPHPRPPGEDLALARKGNERLSGGGDAGAGPSGPSGSKAKGRENGNGAGNGSSATQATKKRKGDGSSA